MKISKTSRVGALLDGSHARTVEEFLAQPNAFDPIAVRSALTSAIYKAFKEGDAVHGTPAADSDPPLPEVSKV